MQVSLAGKVAVVTGAASGIGLATVREFLASGAQAVIAVDRAPAPPDLPTGATYILGDVSLEATAQAYTAAALAAGGLDIVVNNAGISVVKPLHEHTPEEWDAVMATNVKSVYWSARHVIPVMLARGGGVILNTGSISGVVGIPTQGAYAPSKGALHQLTRQMAIEYAPHGIRVNSVGFGTVDTPIVHDSAEASGDPEAYWAMLRQNHPLGRIASAAEAAGFLTYLASDLASFFTGAILMMDGGYTAR